MTNEENKPKIIIDEDWKSQVEREREQLRPEAPAGDTPQDSSEPAAGPQTAAGELPPASFPILISTLATQALAAMGQLADPETGQAVVHLDFAKYQIDLLAILQEKTRGNLTAEESDMLEGALHELRMIFVHLQTSR